MKIIFKTRKGFTIIELIISISLLCVLLAGIYTLYFHVQKTFNRTNAHLKINQQINTAFLRLERDIHSGMKPNYLTDAVRIVSDNEMHIYSFDDATNKYMRVVYRLNPSDKTILERGLAIYPGKTPPADENPEYETITEWETLIEGIIEEYNGKKSNFSILSVSAPTGELTPSPTPIVRKAVCIVLIVNDPDNPLEEPIVSEKIITSRSNSYPK